MAEQPKAQKSEKQLKKQLPDKLRKKQTEETNECKVC